MARVLVDTSVWIRFLAGREPFATQLDELLEAKEVLAHELVFGELLIGDSGRGRSRSSMLQSFAKLPHAHAVTHGEVVELVVARRLGGQGIGWTDAHLLASALVSPARLWTADESLRRVAERLKIAAH